jgi:hypothetical protein
LGGEKMRCALRTGDDVLGFGVEAEFPQVLGNLSGSPRRVVGDVENSGVDLGQALQSPRSRFMTAEYRAVEIQQQAIVLLHKRRHVRPVP